MIRCRQVGVESAKYRKRMMNWIHLREENGSHLLSIVFSFCFFIFDDGELAKKESPFITGTMSAEAKTGEGKFAVCSRRRLLAEKMGGKSSPKSGAERQLTGDHSERDKG